MSRGVMADSPRTVRSRTEITPLKVPESHRFSRVLTISFRLPMIGYRIAINRTCNMISKHMDNMDMGNTATTSNIHK